MRYLTEAGRHPDDWPRWKHAGWIVFWIALPWLMLALLVAAVYEVLVWVGAL